VICMALCREARQEIKLRQNCSIKCLTQNHFSVAGLLIRFHMPGKPRSRNVGRATIHLPKSFFSVIAC